MLGSQPLRGRRSQLFIRTEIGFESLWPIGMCSSR
jgi:hypothetical protein